MTCSRGFVARSLVVTLLLAGCAARSGTQAPQSPVEFGSPAPPFDQPGVDWGNPIGGIPVEDLGSVQQDFAFTLLIPSGLGRPTGIYETDPSVVPEGDRVLEFVYDTEAYGRVVVTEHLPDMPAEEWKADALKLIAMNGDPMTHGSATLLSVRHGNDALATTSEDGTVSDIRWLQDGTFEVLVRGPTLSLEQCEAIANGL